MSFTVLPCVQRLAVKLKIHEPQATRRLLFIRNPAAIVQVIFADEP
jgi:hypothetical protein